MAEFIEILSPKALSDLEKLNSMLVETVSSVDKVNQKFKSITTPSGVDSGLKGLTAEYAKQEKLIAELQIKLQRLAQAQQQTITATNRAEASTMRLNKQKEAQIKALEREQAKLEASANIYNKVQAKLNVLSNEYKNLATKKELFNNLTAKEEQRYASLQTKIQKYDQVLKGVDASMGKYQRNVGNYASAFNPLSNSINQLTREMPAFANSVQTGFMAISNNLPIFFDAISQTRDELRALKAQGQEVPSLFSRLTSSVLSWGTALSVGVTLLTVFGDEIIDSIFNTKAKAKADEEAKKALEAKAQAEQRNLDLITESASKEQSHARILIENAKNVNLSYKQRVEAVTELQKKYPEYFGALSKEEIMAGKVTDAENKLNEALLKRGIALSLQSKLTEKYNELSGVLLKINEIQTASTALSKEDIDTAKKLGISTQQLMKDKDLLRRLELRRLYEQKKGIETEINGIAGLYNKYSPYLDTVVETTNAQEALNKARLADPSSLKAMEDMISALEKELQVTDLTSERYKFLSGVLSAVKLSYDALIESMKDKEALEIGSVGVQKTVDANKLLHDSAQQAIKDFEAQQEATKKQAETLAQLEQQMRDYASSFTGEFFNKSGFPTLFKALNGEILGFGKNWEVTFQAIGEIAQETFAYVSKLSEQRFKQEYERLSQEKEIALAFAGDSATAREEIERQYQERQREIKRREFKAKQQEALANIAMDTAQAIVGLWVKPGFPQAIPMAITVGALGLAQMAMVASQQIPQYWTGTDNAKQGWAWTQEKGREIITDKHGRVKSTGSDGGAKLTYLEQGDKVYNATKSALMFDSALNSMLMDRGVSMPKIEVGSGLNESHVNRIVEAVRDIDPVSLNIDKSGLNAYVGNGHSRRELSNMRVRGKGRNV